MTHRIAAVLGAVGALLFLAACGGTSLGPAGEGSAPLPTASPTPVEPADPEPRLALEIVDAVAATQAAGTARTSTTVTMSTPSLPDGFTVGASGRFDFVNHRGRFDVSQGALLAEFEPGSEFEQEFIPSTVVVDGLSLYLNYPGLPRLFPDLRPSVKPWVRTAEDELTDELVTDLGAAAQIGRADPSQMLVWLRATSIDVEEVGTETVGDVETTRYRTSVDLTEVPEFAPLTEQDAYEQQIEALATRAPVRAVPVDVWIGADGLVRRVSSELDVRLGKALRTSSVRWTVDLFDFGESALQGIPREARVMSYREFLQLAPPAPLRHGRGAVDASGDAATPPAAGEPPASDAAGG